jgi:Ca2+/Na+ antiporter
MKIEAILKRIFKQLLVPLSFLMCSAWIGAITYVVAWMISLIGYTFGIPDSVMGLTFLAIGTSVPEVFSSLIVSKQV